MLDDLVDSGLFGPYLDPDIVLELSDGDRGDQDQDHAVLVLPNELLGSYLFG